ncbi:rod shape-determining protein MreC [Poseidonocella sp. HB161398]|uniref:rod shape-determining protein MreC n=1 Tax=Poseidonocella sp. HB161398 TaxID=2320855 RepID=UPI001109F0C7|nr:rod shape-determining protein MreC [Poseidonocella sp. HB161398]
MPQDKDSSAQYIRPIRRILVGALVLCLIAIFLFWRIDSPRAERLRMAVVDELAPRFAWVTAPATWAGKMVEDFQSYNRLWEQNQQLRRELQQMKAWKEAALQLEQKNAKLLDLNNVRLDPKLTYVSGVVIADSGSPFRQSVLINIGAHDRIRDGWAVMDGLGVVGRISGVARNTARVLLLTDSNSAVPVTIQPSGQKALLQGDNTVAPFIEFLESAELVRPGDRVVTSGAGGVLPPGLLVGQVAQTPDGRLRVRLAADYARLEVLQVLRTPQREKITESGTLVAPDPLLAAPEAQGPALPDG